LWLACVLPFLERTRLQDVDELAYAQVAKNAAVQGHWWPLMSQGRVFYEKPPLQIWLAAALATASPLAAWPYRLWTALGAGLGLAALVALGLLLRRARAGGIAALLLALQGDWLFHARFFSFDAGYVGLALAALAAGVWAAQGPVGRWWLPGLVLGLAVWIKSWFVLALGPAWAWALWFSLAPVQRRKAAWRLALPVVLGFLLWLALSVDWNGWGFLSEEWNQNLVGRALGFNNQLDPDGNLAYYLKWAQRSTPALLPLALAVPVALAWPRPGEDAPSKLAASFAWALCLSWLLGLALVRAQTINYLLPLEAGLALAAGLALDAAWGGAEGAALAALVLVCAMATQRPWAPVWSLALGLPLGLAWAWSRGRGGFGRPWAVWAASAVLVLLMVPDAVRLELRPLDGSAQLADVLLAHPARRPGEPLWLLGPPTLAADFYSDYAVLRPSSPPMGRPKQACLVHGQAGWIFFPAQDSLPGRS
jgi:4-amino-4-deoxy-L-arabinose transferase-like glycosyltransferase